MTSKANANVFHSKRSIVLRGAAALTAAGLVGAWALSALMPEPARPAVSVIAATSAGPADRSNELAMAWEQERRKRTAPAPSIDSSLAVAKPSIAKVEGPTSEQAREMAEMFDDYDSQLQPNASLPQWAQGRDFRANVASIDSNTTLQQVACADTFCKLSLTSAAGASQQEVIERVGSAVIDNGGAVVYRYFYDKPQQFALYVMKPVPQPTELPAVVPPTPSPQGAE